MQPVLVPSLDEIRRDPSRLTGLPADALAALAGACAAVQAALAAAQLVLITNDWMAARRGHNDESGQPRDDHMLTVYEAAERLRRKPQWLYRNANHLPFVRRISRKSLLVSEASLNAYLA